MAVKIKDTLWRPEPKPKRRNKPHPLHHQKKLNKHSKWRKR